MLAQSANDGLDSLVYPSLAPLVYRQLEAVPTRLVAALLMPLNIQGMFGIVKANVLLEHI
tara:strand:- start:126 stop:305 length:180 start_codon:yes stop_codon:yes gene_type:complete